MPLLCSRQASDADDGGTDAAAAVVAAAANANDDAAWISDAAADGTQMSADYGDDDDGADHRLLTASRNDSCFSATVPNRVRNRRSDRYHCIRPESVTNRDCYDDDVRHVADDAVHVQRHSAIVERIATNRSSDFCAAHSHSPGPVSN